MLYTTKVCYFKKIYVVLYHINIANIFRRNEIHFFRIILICQVLYFAATQNCMTYVTLFLITLCMGISVVSAQDTMQYRTLKDIECSWSNADCWEVFVDAHWQPAEYAPCVLTAPELVVISKNTRLLCDISLSDFPPEHVFIDEDAILIVINTDFICRSSLTIKGVFKNSGSGGIRSVPKLEICNGGTIFSERQMDFFVDELVFKQGSIHGDVSSAFYIDSLLFVPSDYSAEIGRAHIFQQGKTLIQGIIDFTSTAGDKEFAQSIFLEGATWINSAGENFMVAGDMHITESSIITAASAHITIQGNLILADAHFPRSNDTYIYSTFTVVHDIIISGGNSTYESGTFTCTNFIVQTGSIDFTGKIGSKTIEGDFIVASSGSFSNSDNENFSISGNVIINGSFTSGTGRFILEGNDKYVEGNCEFFKLRIDGTYTNKCMVDVPLFVKDEFDGSGVLYQVEGSYVKSRAPTMPETHSLAGSFIEITGRKRQIYIPAGTYVSLILNNPVAEYIVLGDIIITDALIFEAPTLLVLNGHTLTFPSWTNQAIQAPLDSEFRIVLLGGAVRAEQVAYLEKVVFPLAVTSDIETYARIEIINHEQNSHTFVADSVTAYVTRDASSNKDMCLQSNIVGLMYFISSDCAHAELSLFWHKQQELDFFEQIFCNMYHFSGGIWNALQEPDVVDIITEHDVFGRTAYTNSFSPFFINGEGSMLSVDLEIYTVKSLQNTHTIEWTSSDERNTKKYILEKSYDGINFSECAQIFPHDTKQYQYTNTLFSYTEKTYYRLARITHENVVVYYTILVAENPVLHRICTERSRVLYQSYDDSVKEIIIFSVLGTRIEKQYISTRYESRELPSGLYFVQISQGSKTNTQTVFIP